MFQKVYLDGTGVQSRTWNHVKKGQKVGQGLLHGLRSWNLILGLGWLQDPSGAVWEKGKEPGSWKPGVRESLGSWGQHLSAMLMTLLSLAASHGEDTVLEHQWFSRDPPPQNTSSADRSQTAGIPAAVGTKAGCQGSHDLGS